jgi:leader peptidase (prepilin peptidase)/N-methyltransferase
VSGVCHTAGAVYSTSRMIRILGAIFAGMLGLEFGSFLNVCLIRCPEGESIVSPRSHCRNCDHTLTWWENIPLLSWLALRGRCRNCLEPISRRYPLVELAIAALWAMIMWNALRWCQSQDCLSMPDHAVPSISFFFFLQGGKMILCWLLVALAVLDAEHLWLPNWLTIPGIALGIANKFLILAWIVRIHDPDSFEPGRLGPYGAAAKWLLGIVLAAGLILLIRWLYWLIRKREGIGIGDAKLMALLAAWLGLPGALLSFGIGAVLGAVVALILLAVPAARRESESWAATKLPLGTFLCIGGIISTLWGEPIIAAYLRWAGL